MLTWIWAADVADTWHGGSVYSEYMQRGTDGQRDYDIGERGGDKRGRGRGGKRRRGEKSAR